MLNHLLFNAFNQAPAILMSRFLRFVFVETFFGGHEGRLSQLAFLELANQFVVFLDFLVDVILVQLIIAHSCLYLHLLTFKTLGL